MSPPDLALVAPYPTAGRRHAGPSGVASYTANLAHALTSRGLRVDVVAPVEPEEPDDPRAAGSDDSLDGDVHVFRPFERGPSALPTASAAALDTGAPVVHLQHETFLYGGPSAVPGLVPALTSLRRARPSVVTLHQVVDPTTIDRGFTHLHRVNVPPWMARLALGSVQRAAASISSACIVHEASFSSVVPRSVVIPHGVERRPTPDRASARAHLDLDDRFVALCFGFLAPYKGLEAVLEAGRRVGSDRMQVVVAGGPHPRLAAAGDDYGAQLRDRYEGDGARFTGWVPEADVSSWFAAADVAVFGYPAPFSSSGALALAFAHGTPVLMSEAMAECVGAPPEVVTRTDPESLSARLDELASADGRARLSAASAALAGGRDWAAVADRHIDLYERLVA